VFLVVSLLKYLDSNITGSVQKKFIKEAPFFHRS